MRVPDLIRRPAARLAAIAVGLMAVIAALIAQGISPIDAVTTAARIHGQAAEVLTERLGGMIGITASELIPEIRQLINR